MNWRIINGKLVQVDENGAPVEGTERDLVVILTAEQLTELDPTEAQLTAMVEAIDLEVEAWKLVGTGSAAATIRRLIEHRNVLASTVNEIRTPAPEPVAIVDRPAATASTEGGNQGDEGNQGNQGDEGKEGTDGKTVKEGETSTEGKPVKDLAAIAAGLDPDTGVATPAAGQAVVVHGPAAPADTDWSDLTGAKALDAMRASLAPDVIDQIADDTKPHTRGLPIAAGLGKPGQGYALEPSADWADQAMKVANRFVGTENTTEGVPLFAWDRMHASIDPRTNQPLEKLGRDPFRNRQLLNDPVYMELAGAMFADLCGIPEIDRMRTDPCGVRTDEPILAAMGTPAPIGNGKISFFEEIYDLTMLGGVLPQIWYEANQNAVDELDRATWKGCATLPGCNGQVDVTMYLIPACLRICQEDEISRPEVIEQAQLIMRVLLARLAESYRLDVIDGYTGINGHVYSHDFSQTGYGAALEFHNMICRVMIGLSEFARKDLSTFDVIVPAHFAKLLWLDEVNAGRTRLDVGQVVAWMQNEVQLAGFRSLVITPDYGSAEGATFGQLAPGAGAGGTVGDPYAQPPVVTPKFDAVVPVPGQTADATPALPTGACIRITDLGEYQPGLQTLVPWELRRSPDLLRQNCAEFFGESGQILYKKGCAETFRIDAYNICPNGARINEGVSPFTCP